MSAGELRELAFQLGRIPVELRAQLRPALAAAGESVRADAAARAAVWSTRIPAAIRVRPVFAGKGIGVFVLAAASVAPHARAYEGLASGGATFRHPVFGDRSTWVSQAARPFLAPAADAAGPEVLAAVRTAIDAAARAGGFR